MQKKNRDEEKVFSVLMTDEELSLFSEFLEQRDAVGDLFGKPRESAKYYSESYQKDFARADYAGLDPSQQARLRAERSELAKKLNTERKMNNESLNNLLGNKKAQSRANYGNRVNKIGLERNLDHMDSLARSKQLSTQARNNILSQPKIMNQPAKITPASTSKSLPSVISTSNKVNPALQGKVTNLRRLATTKNMVGKGALLAGAAAATALTYNHLKKKRENN